MTKRRGWLLGVLALGLCLGGCGTKSYMRRVDTLEGGEKKRVLIRCDVEIQRVAAGNVPEPQVERSEQARAYLQSALTEDLSALGLDAVLYAEPEAGSTQEAELEQLFKFHEVVVWSAASGRVLPTVRDRFEWNLGPGVRSLSEGGDADYAVLATFLDRDFTLGRVFLGGSQGEGQFGLASLVDLRSGDLVWMGRAAFPSALGSKLDDPDHAKSMVEAVLRGFPQ